MIMVLFLYVKRIAISGNGCFRQWARLPGKKSRFLSRLVVLFVSHENHYQRQSETMRWSGDMWGALCSGVAGSGFLYLSEKFGPGWSVLLSDHKQSTSNLNMIYKRSCLTCR